MTASRDRMQSRTADSSLPLSGDDERLAADTLALHRALSELIRVYQFRDRDRICCYDITVTQCYALEATVLHGPLSVNDLVAELYLDKSTVSRAVDALYRKGYVGRREDPEDRRALLIKATEQGRDLHGRIENDILASERNLLAGFAPEVRPAMAEFMAKLARAAATRIDTTGGSCCVIRSE
jgi:MarR family 2-MHQ and catechol resistance regulon transcriptional repressor